MPNRPFNAELLRADDFEIGFQGSFDRLSLKLEIRNFWKVAHINSNFWKVAHINSLDQLRAFTGFQGLPLARVVVLTQASQVEPYRQLS